VPTFLEQTQRGAKVLQFSRSLGVKTLESDGLTQSHALYLEPRANMMQEWADPRAGKPPTGSDP
jgi:hypothetical protein